MVITPEELKRRQSVIGASDVGIILGVNHWKSPSDIYHDKVFGAEFKGNAATRRGNKYEPMVIEFCEEEIGATIVQDVRYERRVEYEGHTVVFAANCDGIVLRPGEEIKQYDRFEYGEHVPLACVEAKTARELKDWGLPGTDDIPETYLLQTWMQMWCSGAPETFVPVKSGFDDYLYLVKRPPELKLQEMVDACCHFWVHNVLARVVPDGPPARVEVLKTIPREEDSVIDLRDGADTMVREWLDAQEQRLKWTKEEKRLQAELLTMMQDCEIGVSDGGYLSYKADRRGARTLRWIKDPQWTKNRGSGESS